MNLKKSTYEKNNTARPVLRLSGLTVAVVAAMAAGPGGVALFVVLGLATLILWPFLRAIGRAFVRPARPR